MVLTLPVLKFCQQIIKYHKTVVLYVSKWFLKQNNETVYYYFFYFSCLISCITNILNYVMLKVTNKYSFFISLSPAQGNLNSLIESQSLLTLIYLNDQQQKHGVISLSSYLSFETNRVKRNILYRRHVSVLGKMC